MRVKIKTKMPWGLALRLLLLYLNQKQANSFDYFMEQLLKRGIRAYERENVASVSSDT